MLPYNNYIETYSKAQEAKKYQIDRVIQIKNHLEANYKEELDLNTLSNKYFISAYHLLRQFKKYYGLTPKQYLTDIRIRVAKRLLADGLNVKEVCYAVGFQSMSSFSKLFKNKVGQLPSTFSKKSKNRQL